MSHTSTPPAELGNGSANFGADSPEIGYWPKELGRYLLPLASFALLFLLWAVTSHSLNQSENSLLPTPERTFAALVDSLPELWKGTVSSFLILIPGFFAAVVAGIVLGLWAGTSDRLGQAFFPVARVAAPIPPTVYVPYAIAILPTFQLSAIFVVFIGAFWPIFQNAAAGAHAIEARHRDNARILGMSGFEYRRRVVFPSALPHIFSGMAVGLAFSFVLLTVAELFGANAGLGRFVQYYADFADYPRMLAGILYTGLVTFLVMSLLEIIRRRVVFWIR